MRQYVELPRRRKGDGFFRRKESICRTLAPDVGKFDIVYHYTEWLNCGIAQRN